MNTTTRPVRLAGYTPCVRVNPPAPRGECDHCAAADATTHRLMTGPLGPVTVALCADCAADFDQNIAPEMH